MHTECSTSLNRILLVMLLFVSIARRFFTFDMTRRETLFSKARFHTFMHVVSTIHNRHHLSMTVIACKISARLAHNSSFAPVAVVAVAV